LGVVGGRFWLFSEKTKQLVEAAAASGSMYGYGGRGGMQKAAGSRGMR